MASLKYTVDVDTKGARSSIASLENSLGGIGAAVAGAFAVGEIVAFGDSIVGLQNKLRSLTGDQALVGSMFNDITRIAGAARAPLQETGDLYFRIARAAKDLGISQQQTSDITESLAKSMSMTGATAQETSGALLQLGQALQSGRFQGDELRSVLENMPIVSKAMADELGVTIGELRKLGSEGKITSDVFVRAMEKNKKAIDDAFSRSVPTAMQALNNLKTAMGIAFSQLATEDGPGKVFAGMIADLLTLTNDVNALASTIKDLTEIILYAGLAFLTVGKNAIVIRGITAAVVGLGTAFKAVASGSALGLMARNLGGIKASVNGITGAFGPFKAATGAIMTAAKNAGTLGKAFARVAQVVFSLVGILGNVLKIAFRFAGWIGIVIAVAQAVDFLVKKFFGFSIIDTYVMPLVNKLFAKLRQFAEFVGIMDKKATKGGKGGGREARNPDGTAGEFRSQVDGPKGGVFGDASTKLTPKPDIGKGAGKSAKDYANALRDVKKAVIEVTAAFKESSAARLDDLNFQLKSMTMSEDQVSLESQKRDILKEQKTALADLAAKQIEIKESEDLSKKGKAEALALIDQQIVKINAAAEAELAASQTTLQAIQAVNIEREKANGLIELQNLAASNKVALQNMEEQLQLVGLYGDNLDEVTAQLETQQKLREIELKFQEELRKLDSERLAIGEARYANQLALLKAMSAESVEAVKAQAGAQKKIDDLKKKSDRNDVGGALKKRFEELERSVDPAVTAIEGLNSVFSNMGNAIDTFVETGKFKFGDFAKSIILDLTKIAAKAAATKLFSMIGKSIVTALGKKAAGGPTMANKPYVVGEQGPELFVPNSAGSIMTNASLNKNAGGDSGMGATVNNTYITNNISAIDSRSVAQMFVENRKSLLGASMMARKELPYGG
jgi:lambda family phage tail tape measure protein